MKRISIIAGAAAGSCIGAVCGLALRRKLREKPCLEVVLPVRDGMADGRGCIEEDIAGWYWNGGEAAANRLMDRLEGWHARYGDGIAAASSDQDAFRFARASAFFNGRALLTDFMRLDWDGLLRIAGDYE